MATPLLTSLNVIKKYAVIIFILLIICLIVWFFFFRNNNTQDKPNKNENNEQPSYVIKNTNYRILTWNLYNFGKSKNDKELAFIADIVRDFDILAIQEVSTGPEGSQAVAKLSDLLNRKGFKWDYIVSDPTSGDGSEKYAYLWKTSKVKLNRKAWLSEQLADSVDREPYLAHFNNQNDSFLIASFNAIPSSKKPEIENKFLYLIHQKYQSQNMIFLGDFNLSEKKEVFDSLKRRNYLPVLKNQKTSLKRKVKNGERFAREYDNIFFEEMVFKVQSSGIINFTDSFRTLNQSRKISDHLPVWIEMSLKN